MSKKIFWFVQIFFILGGPIETFIYYAPNCFFLKRNLIWFMQIFVILRDQAKFSSVLRFLQILNSFDLYKFYLSWGNKRNFLLFCVPLFFRCIKIIFFLLPCFCCNENSFDLC
jgi:hypothetical protein